MTFTPASVERWWPTVVHIIGLLLVVYGAIEKEFALVTASVGLVLLPTVYGRRNGKNENHK